MQLVFFASQIDLQLEANETNCVAPRILQDLDELWQKYIPSIFSRKLDF